MYFCRIMHIMRQFFVNRYIIGIFLAASALIFILAFKFWSTSDRTNRIFTEKVNALHQKTLEKIRTTKDFSLLETNLPVFIFDQQDSLVYWSEESLREPEAFLNSSDSVFLFSVRNVRGILFKNDLKRFRSFILVPVDGHQFKSESLLNPVLYLKDHREITVTYQKKFEFTLNDNSFDNFHINLLSWLIMIIMLAAVRMLVSGSGKPGIRIFGEKSGNTSFPYGLSIATLLVLLMDLFNALPYDFLLTSVVLRGILPLSPFTLILAIGNAFYLLTWLDKTTFSGDNQTKIPKIAASLSLPLIGFVSIIAVNSTRFIYQNIPANLDLERLFSVSLEEISTLLILLLFFILCIYLIYTLYHLIHQHKMSRKSKLTGLIFALILLVGSGVSNIIKVPIAPFLLGFLILILFLDLYFDKKKYNSNWLVGWMILISAFLSFIIFHADLQKDLTERQNNLQTLLFDRDKELEQENPAKSLSEIPENYLPDTMLIKENVLTSLTGELVEISDSFYFQPMNGSYFRLLPKVVPTGFHTFQILQPKDNSATALTENERPSSVIYKSWSKSPHTEFPSADSIWSEKGTYFVSHTNQTGETIVSAYKIPGLLRPVSLFAAIFFMVSAGLIMISLLSMRIKILPADFNLSFFRQKSLRSRIQVSILSLTITAFFIIGLVSASYFKKIYLIQNEELAKAHARQTQSAIEAKILELSSDKSIQEAGFPVFFPLPPQSVHQAILFHSSFPSAYLYPTFPTETSHWRIPYSLLSAQPDNELEKKIPLLDKERNLIYTPLIFNGNIRYFYSPVRLNEEIQVKISDLLATFLSIYAVLFILSVVIAIGLSNSITNPIDILGQKLKGLKLSRKNETLEWQNEDEIGTLISIYNEMINKLGDNARLMAKIERDSAWKEMAQQVAHEIKNPLTPLKLNIQYLESKVGSNPDVASQLIAQLAPSLIEQIDNLSQIASEFSNFAQLPDARNEKLNLNDIVKKVHDFFRKREDMIFKLTLPINDVLVFADKNHMVRILNNVIKNAIQAIPEDRPGQISIDLYRQESNAVIRVSDNGTGIAENMREKVFSPNFTTKSSGTGLGLAIAINMLESFGGRIYFETEENVGSDFYIEVPLMRLEDNFPQANTVFLED